jgi:hypothetical protein
MSWNVLFWKWSEEYAAPSKRKKIKFRDITTQFAETGGHLAFGEADIHGFRAALDEQFCSDEAVCPFIFERYDNCAVINYTSTARFELVPKLALVGRRFALNAAEF